MRWEVDTAIKLKRHTLESSYLHFAYIPIGAVHDRYAYRVQVNN